MQSTPSPWKGEGWGEGGLAEEGGNVDKVPGRGTP